MTSDPERRRIDELIERVGRGVATDAECVELDLYLEEHPEYADEVSARLRPRDPNHGWLERINADEKLRRRERSPLVRAERATGLALVAGGFVLGPFSPVLAPLAILAGGGILTWSFVRLRLQELKDDPYRKIDR